MSAPTKAESTDKIHEALGLLNEAARDKKDEFSELLSDKYDDLKQVVLGVESGLEASARRGVQKVKTLSHEASEQVKKAVSVVDQKAHDDPWKTLSWAVAGAFVIGILLGRRESSGK